MGDLERFMAKLEAIKAEPEPWRCRARTRQGERCKARRVYGKRVCRIHGGLSTGPRTAAGRAAISASNRRRGAAKEQIEVFRRVFGPTWNPPAGWDKAPPAG